MQLTEQDLDSFIALNKQEFGITISRGEAQKQATALVSLVERIFRPMTKEEFNMVVAKMLEDQ